MSLLGKSSKVPEHIELSVGETNCEVPIRLREVVVDFIRLIMFLNIRIKNHDYSNLSFYFVSFIGQSQKKLFSLACQ